MALPKVGFLRLRQLQAFGFPAQRTLENRMTGGVISLGADVPPLRTVRIGGARVVPVAELAQWLRVTGGLVEATDACDPQQTSAPGAEEAVPVRRGRPRKGSDAMPRRQK